MNHLFELQAEQICYVQCGFCTTILLVSVPCSSLSMVVTVRCGHCTSLLSVNMLKVSFVPFHLLTSNPFAHHQGIKGVDNPDVDEDQMEVPKALDTSSDDKDLLSDDDFSNPLLNPVINKPPEKRQRAPSAYNCFIKQEIRRLKAENPNMPHKEAFSTAAKNWAHFPPTYCKEDASLNQDNPQRKADYQVTAPRHSI